MEITQEAIYKVFDLEAPAAEAPVAETEITEIETEETQPESTEEDPAQIEEGAEPETEEAEEAEEAEDTKAGKAQSIEERRRHAAERRRREQQAAIDAAVKAATEAEREKLHNAIARSGMKNPITGAPITTLEELESYNQQVKLARAERELKGGKLTQETLQDIISDHPAIKRAEEIARKAEDAEREAREAAVRSRMDAEVLEIRKLNPSIETLEDILAMPTGKAFYEYVQKGNSLVDAYYLANRETQSAKSVAMAKQQALNLANSKKHLTQDKARGQGALSVPSDEMTMFKAMNPGATEAEIQKYYAKYNKK